MYPSVAQFQWNNFRVCIVEGTRGMKLLFFQSVILWPCSMVIGFNHISSRITLFDNNIINKFRIGTIVLINYEWHKLYEAMRVCSANLINPPLSQTTRTNTTICIYICVNIICGNVRLKLNYLKTFARSIIFWTLVNSFFYFSTIVQNQKIKKNIQYILHCVLCKTFHK